MATTNVQIASFPLEGDLPVYNYSTTTAIAAGQAVMLDVANPVNNAVPGNYAIGVTLPASGGNPSICLGITVDTIPALGTGRVRPGGVATVQCHGAVTIGTFVEATPTAGKVGRVRTSTAAQPSIGLALTSGIDDDIIPVLVLLNKNA